MMRRLLFVLLICGVPAAALAAEGGHLPFEFKADLGNEASLQRGAKIFMNYCSGCHSLQYVRYKRIAEDLNIPEEVMENNLIFTGAKIHDRIPSSMPTKQAEQWFGKAPPDLSLEARYRGADWIYSYLLSFYLDDGTSTGVNNLVLENTSMPDVLWPLQGYQKLLHSGQSYDKSSHSGEPEFKIVQSGRLNQAEYREAMADLVNFLVYVGEPVKLVRYSLGFKVIVFLILFTVLAYLLKREFWRDVH